MPPLRTSSSGNGDGLRLGIRDTRSGRPPTTQPVAAVAAIPVVSSSMNSFGLELLAALQKTTGISGGSVLISPLSVISALGMVSLGLTPGEAADAELLRAWGLNTSQAPSFLVGLERQLSELAGCAKNGVELLSANSVWCKSQIKRSFITAAEKVFHAEAFALPATAAPVNLWCERQTKGKVPSILNEVDPSTAALLVNAVYFKGAWAARFNPRLTARGTFMEKNTVARPCAMMRQSDERMLYAAWPDGTQAVELPYGAVDGRFAAVVLLPPPLSLTGEEEEGRSSPLEELVTQLGAPSGAALLAEMLEELSPRSVELQLPRFRVEFGVRDLSPELKAAFGVVQAFDGVGQFLAMSDDPSVHLSAVLHKVVVEVNEEGSTAAAVTAGVVNVESYELPKRVVVDRPFLFLIRDKLSGALLFIGCIQDPILDLSGV